MVSNLGFPRLDEPLPGLRKSAWHRKVPDELEVAHFSCAHKNMLKLLSQRYGAREARRILS
jgi:hypothetical protein